MGLFQSKIILLLLLKNLNDSKWFVKIVFQIFMIDPSQSTHPNGEVAFALPYSLLVSLPLVGSAGLGHVGGLLPPQALTKLVHLRGHVLPGTVDTERNRGSAAEHHLEFKSTWCGTFCLTHLRSKSDITINRLSSAKTKILNIYGSTYQKLIKEECAKPYFK